MSGAYDAAIARCLIAADPGAALAVELTRATPPVRRWLRAVDLDGLRLSALLVARLRFERLACGSSRFAAWFEADPAACAAAFSAYHAAVPPRAFTPTDEARSWRAWGGSRGFAA